MHDEPLDILLVEDDLGHAKLVMRSLEEHAASCTIRHVSDGEEALDYLLRRGPYGDPAKSPRPQIVLLDLRLPRVDGLEVLKQVKTSPELRGIPVVVLTTSQADNDVAKAYENYANGYLVKPFDFAQWDEMMRAMSSYWLGWNRSPRVNGRASPRNGSPALP